MKKASVLVIAAMALLSAESAMGGNLPLPSLPAVPTVTPPEVLDPVLGAVPTVAPLPPVPTVSVPPLPGATSSPTVPTVPGGPTLPSVPILRPSTSQGGGTAGGSAPGRGPSSGGSGTTSTGGSGGSGGSGSSTPGARGRAGAGKPAGKRPAVRRIRRERRLRKTVRRLQGCFGGLSRLERRVLALRAGIGAGSPRTRTQVARRLDVSTRRVTRLERRGVRTLRGLAGAGRCGAGGGQSTAAAPAGGSRIAAALQGLRGLIGSDTSADRTEVKGERKSSDGQQPNDAAPATKEQRVTGPPRARILGIDLTLPLFIALGFGFLVWAVRAARREFGSGPGA